MAKKQMAGRGQDGSSVSVSSQKNKYHFLNCEYFVGGKQVFWDKIPL